MQCTAMTGIETISYSDNPLILCEGSCVILLYELYPCTRSGTNGKGLIAHKPGIVSLNYTKSCHKKCKPVLPCLTTCYYLIRLSSRALVQKRHKHASNLIPSTDSIRMILHNDTPNARSLCHPYLSFGVNASNHGLLVILVTD